MENDTKSADHLEMSVVQLQSCVQLFCDMGCSPPSFSVRGISQARILQWVSISIIRGPSPPRAEPECLMPPALAGRLFTPESSGELGDVFVAQVTVASFGTSFQTGFHLCFNNKISEFNKQIYFHPLKIPFCVCGYSHTQCHQQESHFITIYILQLHVFKSFSRSQLV